MTHNDASNCSRIKEIPPKSPVIELKSMYQLKSSFSLLLRCCSAFCSLWGLIQSLNDPFHTKCGIFFRSFLFMYSKEAKAMDPSPPLPPSVGSMKLASKMQPSSLLVWHEHQQRGLSLSLSLALFFVCVATPAPLCVISAWRSNIH